MNSLQVHYLNSLFQSISPNSFREIHDCIKFRKLVRFEIYLKDIFKLSQQIQHLSLHYSISDKSFKVVVDNSMDDWASSLENCLDSDSNAMRFLYLHSNKDVCEKAKLFDSVDDDLNLGLLLQYPKCCINAYLNWQQNNDDIDPITIITNSFVFTGELQTFNFPNPFSRYFGSGLFSHFPCSLNCSKTKKIAQLSLRKLQIHFPAIADKILELENSFVIFNKNKGVCLWNSFSATQDNICLSQNSFQGQGELKFIFETVDKIEFSQTDLNLFCNSEPIDIFKTEECFVGLFNDKANVTR